MDSVFLYPNQTPQIGVSPETAVHEHAMYFREIGIRKMEHSFLLGLHF